MNTPKDSELKTLNMIENAYSKAIIRTIPDMFFLLDESFVIMDYKVNDEAALYVPPSEFLNKKVSEVLPKNIVDAFEATGRKALQEDTMADLNFALSYPDGLHYFECRISKVEGQSFLIAIVRNITESTNYMHQLENSEKNYKTLFENAPFPIVIIDEATRTVDYFNERAKRKFKLEHPDHVDSQLYYSDYNQRKIFLDEVVQNSKCDDFEALLIDGDGTPFWALMSGVLIEYKNKVCIMLSINDIQQQKDALKALVIEKIKLKERIKERDCIDWINAITENRDQSIADMMSKILGAIGNGFQYPEIAEVQIQVGDIIYKTQRYQETPWILKAVESEAIPQPVEVKVVYLTEPIKTPLWETELFLPEEQGLLNRICNRIANTLEKRYLEMELEESKGLLNIVFNKSGIGIAIFDPKTFKVIMFNDSAAEIHGYDRDTFKVIVEDLIHSPKSLFVAQKELFYMGQLMEKTFEVTHYKKDGSTVELKVQINRVQHNERELGCLIFTDITEQKRIQTANKLRAENLERDNRVMWSIIQLENKGIYDMQSYYKDLMELIGKSNKIERVSIWLFNEDESELRCVSQYEYLSGRHSSGGVLKSSDFEMEMNYLRKSRYVDANDPLTDPRTAGYVEGYVKPNHITAMLDCSIMSGNRRIGTLCFEVVDRVYRWTDEDIARGCQIADHVGLAVLNRERLDMAEALKQSELFLRRAQEVSHTGHWLLNLQSNSLSCSEEAYRILGIPVNDLTDFDQYLSIIHEDDLPQVKVAWGKAQESGHFQIEHRILSPSGLKWVEQKATLEKDEQGVISYCLGTVQDITERVRTEIELSQYRQNLEEMVIKRTEELETAIQIAEKASQSKSMFISNMSHEIRTPMNAIIGYTHLMTRDPLTNKQKAQLEKITSASMHLLQIINDILDLSKIEANRMVFESTEFEMSRLVDHISEIVEESTRKKSLEFYVSMKQVPEVLYGDETRIGQIILNLVNNAIKFTTQGSVSLNIQRVDSTPIENLLETNKMNPLSDKLLTLRIEVRDTGIGLSKEQMANLFTEFNQGDLSTTRLYGGTGLGLAICKKMVELLGGHIGVESEIGKGSLFWVTLPFLYKDEIEPYRGQQFEGMSVLLIDDDPDAVEIMMNIFEEFGIYAEGVYSGQEGLLKLEASEFNREAYDLIVVDYKMPQMNGLEFIQHLKGMAFEKTPEIIVITAYGNEIEEESHQSLEGIQLLSKPITASKLLDALNTLIHNSHGISVDMSESDIQSKFEALGPKEILLVEDNPINREVTSQLLDFINLIIITAENGKEAVELASKRTFDLVLMDVQMPLMDGFEATKRIRKLPQWDRVPIVAMTAHAFKEDIEQCVVAGMNDHVSKPVVPNKLYNVLLKWLYNYGNDSYELLPESEVQKEDFDETTSKQYAIEKIEGLNIELGLRSLNGKRELLVKLLGLYDVDHVGDGIQIMNQIQQGNYKIAGELAHGLKGVSGTLGLTTIQELAKSIELGIKDNVSKDELNKVCQLLIQSLERFTLDFDNFRKGQAQPEESNRPSPRNPSRPDELKSILSGIEACLRTSDTQANDMAEANRKIIVDTFGHQGVQLLDWISAFEYENAIKLIQALLKDY